MSTAPGRSQSPPKTATRGGRGAAAAARSNLSRPPIIAPPRSDSYEDLTGATSGSGSVSRTDPVPPPQRSPRRTREEEFQSLQRFAEESAHVGQDRHRTTRSRRASEAPEGQAHTRAVDTAYVSAAAPSRSTTRQPPRNIRGHTPDQQQLHQELRLSQEPESPTPKQPQRQVQDVSQHEEQSLEEMSSSSFQDPSNRSWNTERRLLQTQKKHQQPQQPQQPQQQQVEAHRQHQFQPPSQSQLQPQPQALPRAQIQGQIQAQAQYPQHLGLFQASGDISRTSRRRAPVDPAPVAEEPYQSSSQNDTASPADDPARLANNPTQNFPVLHPSSQPVPDPAPIVPHKPRRRKSPTPSDNGSDESTDTSTTAQRASRRARPTTTVLAIIMTVVSAILILLLTFHDHFQGTTPMLRSLCGGLCGNTPFPIPYGASDEAKKALEKLSSTVDSKLADMANDMAVAKAEMEKKIADIPQVSPNPLGPMRVNFLSHGTGAVVDPYISSPTLQPAKSFPVRIFNRLVGLPANVMTPIAALRPWSDVGECWCSPGSYSQLAVLLGYPIIPEEVVIEHIPKEETLDIGAAPYEMELWAEFSPVSTADSDGPSRLRRSGAPTVASSRRGGPNWMPPANGLSMSALDYLLSTLRMTYPNEPDAAFSNNPHMGPNYFRLGKWTYDIHRERNIQRFRLNAVVDMPGYRVKKVVVLATSNWGASHTCMYRVRLHGQV